MLISSSDDYLQATRRLRALILLNPSLGSAGAEELDRLMRAMDSWEQRQADPTSPEPRQRRVVGRLRHQMREIYRQGWADQWSDATAKPRWADRGVSPEMVAAVESGWFSDRGRLLDVGCGLGEVTAWFAEQGYRATGIDFPEAIEQARLRHAASGTRVAADQGAAGADGEAAGGVGSHLALQFMALDICDEEVPPMQFDVVIDRGCLHSISVVLLNRYVRNIALLTAPNATMLLFIKAFRKGQPFGDQAESEHHCRWVSRLFAGCFAIEKHAPTYLNAGGVRDPRNPLPGLVFWLRRSG